MRGSRVTERIRRHQAVPAFTMENGLLTANPEDPPLPRAASARRQPRGDAALSAFKKPAPASQAAPVTAYASTYADCETREGAAGAGSARSASVSIRQMPPARISPGRKRAL